MSSLSELQPSGGAGGGSVELVASGALSNGDKVIVNSDGTVSVVALSETSVSESIPSDSGAYVGSVDYAWGAIAFDPHNEGRFVVVFRDNANSGYGSARIGTVNESGITYGATHVFTSYNAKYFSIAFDPINENQFIVSCMRNGLYGFAGTINNDSTMSFTSSGELDSEATDTEVVFDSGSGNFLILYGHYTNDLYGVAGSITNGTASYGSLTQIDSGIIYRPNLDIASNQNNSGQFVAFYSDNASTDYGYAVVLTLSGTSISVGTRQLINSADTRRNNIIANPDVSGQYIVIYNDDGNLNNGTAVILTVSGTSISVGSEYVFSTGHPEDIGAAFDPTGSGKFVVAYRNDSNSSYCDVVVGTVSGSTISFGSETTIWSGTTRHVEVGFDYVANGKFVVLLEEVLSGLYSRGGQIATTTQTPNLTSSNYIGTADADYADGATANIQIKGATSESQSGLTAGEKYYVQADGTLSTTPDDPSVYAGKAISSTKLIIKG